jgi:cob(I)alamin adenosyltransferase
MTAMLPELKNFILPGGHTIVSYCHLARVVCRRAERMAVHLSEVSYVDELCIRYLNRLSDYLFTLSRKCAKDLGVEEYKWIPRITKK